MALPSRVCLRLWTVSCHMQTPRWALPITGLEIPVGPMAIKIAGRPVNSPFHWSTGPAIIVRNIKPFLSPYPWPLHSVKGSDLRMHFCFWSVNFSFPWLSHTVFPNLRTLSFFFFSFFFSLFFFGPYSDAHFHQSPVIIIKSPKTDCSNPPQDLSRIKIQLWWSHVPVFLWFRRQACYHFPTKFRPWFSAKDRCVDQCIKNTEAPCFGWSK